MPPIDDDEMAKVLESLHDLCTICEAEPTMHDAKGLPWCDEHRVRGEFVDYGAVHDWPALETDKYAIAHGEWFWIQDAMLATEECLLALFVEAIGREQPEELSA